MERFLSSQEEAELGIVVRAVQDLCEKLEVNRSTVSLLAALVEGTVRTALLRAKPDSVPSYLAQWRQFLCWLPEVIERTPEKDRVAIAEKALRQFRLVDQRGKNKPTSAIPDGTNCLLMKDGELWYAKIPAEDMPGPGDNNPPPADLKAALDGGEQIFTSEVVSSALKTERAEYLRPFYPPGVLKREHQKLLGALPLDPIGEKEEQIIAAIKDVAPRLLGTWLRDGVTRTDLALLIAARRAGLTAKATNLPHLHTALRWARL